MNKARATSSYPTRYEGCRGEINRVKPVRYTSLVQSIVHHRPHPPGLHLSHPLGTLQPVVARPPPSTSRSLDTRMLMSVRLVGLLWGVSLFSPESYQNRILPAPRLCCPYLSISLAGSGGPSQSFLQYLPVQTQVCH